MEHHQRRAFAAEFARGQIQRRAHDTMRVAEKLMPAKVISSPFG